ncbi:hypothetical protein FOZ63_018940 [Perkinsus olseni]|uniref:Uncharacterized protein n=1 Tax=Perkinsus olseni TaxID=32597 RepID=A0A7J6SRH2_PEROL|nr:hypothetical protein FOZ63_018940 [Perkinsus olseni]
MQSLRAGSVRSTLVAFGSLVFTVASVHGGGFSQDRASDAIADQCSGIVIAGEHSTRSQLAQAASTREHPYTLWTIGEDRGTFSKHACERVIDSPRRNKGLQYEVLTKCDGLPTKAYFPDEEAAVDFAVQWGRLQEFEVDPGVLGDGWVDKNPFSRFAVFKKKLTAAHVKFDRSRRPVERFLKVAVRMNHETRPACMDLQIGSKTGVYCEEMTSGPVSHGDKWKLRVTCTKEKSKKTKTFDIAFKDKNSAMSLATIWGGYATEVPMSAKTIKGSSIQAAELLVSPATGRARKRIIRPQDNKPRTCRAVADVLYKGEAADVVVECDKEMLTIPFTAYQRAERFAARWGGFKKVDEDVVESCPKMEIAGHVDDLVRATSDVGSMGRKIIAGRLETSDGSKLRCDRVNEPVSYEGDIDKYTVKTKCQDRTTRIICDNEDAAWRFSAQWSNFRAGVSTNLGLVSASTRVEVHHNGKLFPFTLATANVESHVKAPSVRMRWLGLRYAGTSVKDDQELSRQWFVCSKVKTIRETDGGEYHVITTCGLSIRNRTPSPEHGDNEVAVVFAKKEQATDFAVQWGQYNPMNVRDVDVIYSSEPVADVVTAAYYRDTLSGKRSGNAFTTREASFECGNISGMEYQIDGAVHLRTECSGERNGKDLAQADTQLVLKRAETAVKWAVKWGGVANPECSPPLSFQIHMSSEMLSGATAAVEGQVTGVASIAKLVYASTGTLQRRVVELDDESGKTFVYTCEGVSSDITMQGSTYTVHVLCGPSTVQLTFPSQELGVAFSRYFCGMNSASVNSDAEYISSCRNAVIGTGGVHELKHAWLREDAGTGEVKRLLVVHGEEEELSCSNVVNPPQFDDGVYKISVVCGSKPVTITCTDSDPAVLLATRWGAYPHYEVEKAGISTRVTCDGLKHNPQVGSGDVEISIDCHEEESETPKKLELLCSTPSDAVQVCKGPLFEKQDTVVEISSRVRSACDVVTVSGQAALMHLTAASIQDSAVVVAIAGEGESNTRQFSCSNLLGSPEITRHQTLILHAKCEEEVLNFECKDMAAALQLASLGRIDQPAIALQQETINSCPEVRQEGISNAFSLSKATYRPSSVKNSGPFRLSGSGGEQKRWLTVTLKNDEEPGYEDSDFLLSCNAVASMPEPSTTLNRDADKYKVLVECDNAEGMGGTTKVEVLCDDFQNAMQLALVWGSLESSYAARIELTTLHSHLKAAWLDSGKVDLSKVHMFVPRPQTGGNSPTQTGESEEDSILQIGPMSYKCDPRAPHRVYFKQFFYYVTMRCNEYSHEKGNSGEAHKVTLIANSEEGALTMARAFAKLAVDKVWIDPILYFAGEEGAAMIGDTKADLTKAYINVFPREYVLDFNGAFQYSCDGASQAPRYTTENKYQVSLTCGKRVGDEEPEQKEQVVTIAFSTPSKAIGFSNGFGGLLYHEVDFDPRIIRTVNYIAPTPEQHMGREEIYPLKRATVKFDLNGRLTSRRIEFLRADQFYGSDNGERTYHPVKFECDEKLILDRKSDKSSRILATTLTATCVETYGGFHQQHADKVKLTMAFRRFPEAAEPFMSWWRGNFRAVDIQEGSSANSAQVPGLLRNIEK